jgi:predicted MPP superfamily phosphohydrolase
MGQVAVNAVLLVAAGGLLWSGSRRALQLVALLPLVFVPFSYARLRLHRLLESDLGGSALAVLCVLGLIFDAVMVAQLIAARQVDVPILQASGVTWIGAVWFSAHALLLLGFGLAGLVRGIARGSGAARRLASPGRYEPAPVDELVLGRRELLQKAGLFGAAVPFGVSLSAVPLSYDFRIEQREIVLPLWPAALDGLRVVHLSDIHVGGAMNAQRVQHVADLVNACRPDLVLHTGDFLTHRFGDFDAPLYSALARIRAPYGQWACFGNHDYDDPQRLERKLQESGVVTLRDRCVVRSLGGASLEIAGCEYLFSRAVRASRYREVVAAWGPRRDRPRLLLNHDPSAFTSLPADCADLVLSGHTHGGHIGVQLSASRAITVVGLAGLPDQGLFARGDMRLYVTRCVGFYGYPMRIGIPPEIALLILRSPEVVGRPPTAARSI